MIITPDEPPISKVLRIRVLDADGNQIGYVTIRVEGEAPCAAS